MPAVTGAAVAVAIGLDLAIEEIPEPIHPVALFGRVVQPVDRAWRHPRVVGSVAALTLPAGAAALLGAVVTITRGVHPAPGVALAGVVLFSTISLRMLLSVAADVVDLVPTDQEQARTRIRALVGRDATSLSPGELRSAVVESLAENLADGFVAPLFGFVIGAQVSLGMAVAAAVWVKAVNTLDSMLGYETKPVGWASARLDDLVMWLPARLTAVLLAVAGRDPGALGRAKAWAGAPPSPNSGWPMGAIAAVLDVQLRKPGAYTLNPDGPLPSASQAGRAIRLVAIAGLIAGGLSVVIAWS